MIAHHTLLFRLLDGLADAVNPALGICLLIFLFGATRRREISWRTWVAALLGVAVVYLLQNLDHYGHWWKRIGSDYSTHSALALALAIPIGILRPKLWPTLLAVLLGYAVLMMILGFHTLLDISTTALVIAPIVVLLQRIFLEKRTEVLVNASGSSDSDSVR
jgi:hypothetical protein